MNSLNTIFRKINNKKELTSGEVLVIINPKIPKLFEKVPLFFESHDLYAANCLNIAKCEGISYLFDENLTKILFSVSCIDGSEAFALKKLYSISGVNLEDRLNTYVRQFVREFVEAQNFEGRVPPFNQLIEYIRQRAKDKLYLKVNSKIEAEWNNNIVHKISSKIFEIRVEEEALTLRFDLEYETEDINKKLSNNERISKLEELLGAEIKNFFLNQNLRIHSYVYEFDSVVKSKLEHLVSQRLKEYGLKMRFVIFKSDSINSLRVKEDPLKIEHTFNCKIEEYNGQIHVNVEVRLRLNDLGKLRKINKGDSFDKWFKHKVLIPIVERNLFQITFKRLLIDIKNVRQIIADEIQEQARLVGYDVEHHVFFPDIKQLNLVEEGFYFEEIKGVYKTKDFKVSFPLNVMIRGKLSDLNGINERYLQNQTDLEEEIKKLIVDSIKEVIAAEDPELVYMRFNVIEGQTKTVEEKVIEKIKKNLFEIFKIDPNSLSINITPGENHMTDKVLELRVNNHQITFEVHPEESVTGHNQLINYSLFFKVNGVREDGWAVFQEGSRKRDAQQEISEVKRLLSEVLETKFGELNYETHIASDKNIRKAFDDSTQIVLNEIGVKFGLSLELVNLKRNRTFLETTKLDIKNKEIETRAALSITNEHHEIDEAIATLRAKMREEMLKGVGKEIEDDDISEIEKRIGILQKMKASLGQSGNMLESQNQKVRQSLLLREMDDANDEKKS